VFLIDEQDEERDDGLTHWLHVTLSSSEPKLEEDCRRTPMHADHRISIGFIACSFRQVLHSLCKEASEVVVRVTGLLPKSWCA
jgi:hypothetical protein